MTMVISGSDGITFPDSTNQFSGGAFSFKNRIINGDMRIDQRNAGASVVWANAVFLDRWRFSSAQLTTANADIQQNAGSVTPPNGFTNYLGITVTATESLLSGIQAARFVQRIEGFNVADFNWGTSDAKTIAISFWVRSSLTGAFGIVVSNLIDRNYVSSYTINSANTWEYKTITIPGDTTGTWLTNNSTGIDLRFMLDSNAAIERAPGSWASSKTGLTGQTKLFETNGATWFITGVQLEVGSVATPFERRPYGTELALCQRYYYKASSTGTPLGTGYNNTTTDTQTMTTFPVTMRTAPTALEQSGTAADYRVYHANIATTCSSVPTFSYGAVGFATTSFIVSSGLTAGQGSASGVAGGGITSFLAWSAEL